MPGDNRLWFDDDQGIAPRRPEPTRQSLKHPLLGLPSKVRIVALKDVQLLTESKDFKSEPASGAKEGTEAEEPFEKCNHELEYIAWGPILILALTD